MVQYNFCYCIVVGVRDINAGVGMKSFSRIQSPVAHLYSILKIKKLHVVYYIM